VSQRITADQLRLDAHVLRHDDGSADVCSTQPI
jgi:hypothetical protein